jgi:hypothetical protein
MAMADSMIRKDRKQDNRIYGNLAIRKSVFREIMICAFAFPTPLSPDDAMQNDRFMQTTPL